MSSRKPCASSSQFQLSAGCVRLCVGGTSEAEDRRALQRGVQVVIGTPGHICGLARRGRLRLDQVRMLVLDEAQASALTTEWIWLASSRVREDHSLRVPGQSSRRCSTAMANAPVLPVPELACAMVSSPAIMGVAAMR